MTGVQTCALPIYSTALCANVILSHPNTVILGHDANVGIVTTSPSHKLDIAGAANLNNGIASGVALRCNEMKHYGITAAISAGGMMLLTIISPIR